MTLQRASAPRPDVHASGRLSLGFARPAPEHPDRRERPRPTVPRRARGRRSATAPKTPMPRQVSVGRVRRRRLRTVVATLRNLVAASGQLLLATNSWVSAMILVGPGCSRVGETTVNPTQGCDSSTRCGARAHSYPSFLDGREPSALVSGRLALTAEHCLPDKAAQAQPNTLLSPSVVCGLRTCLTSSAHHLVDCQVRIRICCCRPRCLHMVRQRLMPAFRHAVDHGARVVTARCCWGCLC